MMSFDHKTPWCRLTFALLVLGALLCQVEGQGDDVVCADPLGVADNSLPDGSFTATSSLEGLSPVNARSSEGGWCPSADDDSPCLTLNLTVLTAVRKIEFFHPDGRSDFAETYDMQTLSPGQDDFRTRYTNLKALTDDRRFSITFTPPMVVSAFKICPRTSGDGLPCFRFEGTGCENEALCPAVTCPGSTECIGVNYCKCAVGQFGSRCSFTAETFDHDVVTLQGAVVEDDQSVTLGDGTKLTGTVFDEDSSISIVNGFKSYALRVQGANAYVSIPAGDYIKDLRTNTAFTISMGLSVTFESETATFPIIASNHLANLQGVSMTVENGDLIVKVLAGQYRWNITVKNILGEDVCTLEKETGMCDRQWYYNADTSRCERYGWGMCGSNDNAFSNRKKCQEACIDNSEAGCSVAVVQEECPKAEKKYFYNRRSRQCQQFHSHSCGSNGNNFDEEEACKETCVQNKKAATLVSGRWYKFSLSWSSLSGIRLYINNKRVDARFNAIVLDPLTDPVTVPATTEFTIGYSSLITDDYQTDLAFEEFNFWPMEYNTVKLLVDSFGESVECYGPGSLGSYDHESCTCREGFLGQFCNQTADSQRIGFVSFENTASGFLDSSLGKLSKIEGDISVHDGSVFTFTSAAAEQLSFDFDVGCIGKLSCRDGATFSAKASFAAATTVVLFSIKDVESQSEVGLYYTGGKLAVYLKMAETQYLLQYSYTATVDQAVFTVSYSATFGLTLIIDDLVVATVTEVATAATVTDFFENLDLENLDSQTITSFGYAAFHYSQLAMAAISISDVCRDDFCENGGVCRGLSGCQCGTGFRGFRCNIKDEQDIMYNTVDAATLLGEDFLDFSVTARGKYRAVGNSVVLDSREESSFLQMETMNQCLRNPGHCLNGITMSMEFAVKKSEEDSFIVFLSTGGDEEYSGFYLAYDFEEEQYICVYQTYRQRWSLKVDYKLSRNTRLNIGFSWDGQGLSLFVDNVFIGQTKEYEVLEYGEVTRPAGSLRLGSCYTGLSTQTWEMKIYFFSSYSASLTMLGELDILTVTEEEEDEGLPCDKSPCVNGQCQNKPDNAYTCRCYIFFKGENCDVPESESQVNRFSFLSIVKYEEYTSIKTPTFPLRGYGDISLVREENTNFIRCTGGDSNIQLNFRRLTKITTLFTTKTLTGTDTSAFAFSFNFRLVATATTTTRLILFSMGELVDGALETTGMIVYYLGGRIYCTLSLPEQKYEVSFEYTLEELSSLKTFDFSFDLTSGLVIRSRKASETAVTVSQATFSVQSYEVTAIYEAFIGSRGQEVKDYALEISNCGFAEQTAIDIESTSGTLGLCSTDYCLNNGVCSGLDQCLCDADTSFTGPDCSIKAADIEKEYNYFSSSETGVIETTEGPSGTTHGDVTVATETTLTASTTGTYIELATSSIPCLGDPSACTLGLTLCLEMKFTTLADDSHLCLLSTGGETSYGMSLTFDNDEGVLGANVKLPYRTWSIDASFSPVLNKEYNICLSWSGQDGAAISVNNKIEAHKRDFVFSKVRMPNWPLSRDLRFGSCYGDVHTETWSFTMKSYQYYEASLHYLSQADLITVEIPQPPPKEPEVCEVKTFKTKMTSIVSTSLGLMDASADKDTQCSLLAKEISEAETSVSGCWKKDESSVSSSPLSFIRYTQRSNLRAFRAIYERQCKQTSPVTETSCDVAERVQAFFAATNADSFSIGACKSVRDIYVEFEAYIKDNCAQETIDLLTTLQVSMQTTVRSVCAKSTCNVGYASTCINESVAVLTTITTDDGYTDGVCRQIKQSMACFSNHTVDCGKDTYRSLSRRVEEIHETYQKHCFLKPPTPVDPTDCEAQTADQLDRIYSLLASIDSTFFSPDEICKLVKANRNLLSVVPEVMTSDRLAEFKRAQQILLSYTAQCVTCTCNLPAAQTCQSNADSLLREITVDCSKVRENLSCMRENTNGCADTDTATVDAMFSGINSLLRGAVECENLDPGPEYCLACDMNAVTTCKGTAADICTSDYLQCLKDSMKNCGVLTRLTQSLGFRSMYKTACTGDLNSALASIRGSDYPFAELEQCLEDNNPSTATGIDDSCTLFSSFGNCINTLSFEKPYNMILSDLKNSSQRIKDICNKPRPDISMCPTNGDCISMVAVPTITKSLNGLNSLQSFCGEAQRERLEGCFPTNCDNEAAAMFFDEGRDWALNSHRNSCNIASQEEIAAGCSLPAAVTCVKDLTTNMFTDGNPSCGAVAAAKDCVHRNTLQCPRRLKQKTYKLMKMLGKLKAKECCLARASTCDPAAAVMCVLDVTHLARMPSPDWEGICGKVEPSMDCMRSFTDSCEDCKKNTVHYIAQRLNEDIVKTCKNPPKTHCKVTKALACVKKLKDFAAFTESEEVFDDAVCLRVHEAQNCIKAVADECEETVRFTIDYELNKVIRVLDAEECKVTDMTKNCADIFRERVENILKYDPRSPDNPRCRVPGMKGPEYTDLEECEPDLTCEAGLVPRHRATIPRPMKGGKSAKEKKSKEGSKEDKKSKEGSKEDKKSKEGSKEDKKSKEGSKEDKKSKEGSKEDKKSKEGSKEDKKSKEGSKEAKGSKKETHGSQEWSFDWSTTDSYWVCAPECEEGSWLEYIPSEMEDEYELQCVSPYSDEDSDRSGGSEEHKKSKEGSEEHKKSKEGSKEHKKSKEGSKEDKKSKEGSKEDKKSKEGSKEDKKSKEGSKEDKKSKEGSKEHKKSKEGSKEHKKSKEKSKEHESRRLVFKNRLDHLCTEARSAWTCVQRDLKGKQDSRSRVLMQTLSGLWSLAMQKCDAGEEEFYCYSCDGELDKDQCNVNRTVCSNKETVCFSRMHRDDENKLLSIKKGCAATKDCVPGCADGTCTYCCTDGGCNKPLEGPVSPVCSVSYAAKCALTLTQTLASSSRLECSAFELELSCMREVREKCVTGNQYQLMNLTESLYQSVAFKQCLLKLAPPTCSLQSVVSLGMILTGSNMNRQDVCRNYDATYEAVLHARMTEGCSSSLLRQVDSSVRLARSQLRGYGCPSIDPNKDYCKPELQSCDINKAQECVKGIDKLVGKASFTERADNCRELVRMSTCLLRYSKSCSLTQGITIKAIKDRFEMISSRLRDRCDEEVRAASCDEDKERRCQPMKAFTSCFRDFSIANIFDDCQNVKLVKSCILEYTRGCLPIQRNMPNTLLWMQPNMAAIMNRCPREEEEETPYTQVMMCLGQFSMNLKTSLSRPCNSMARVCTSSINIVRNCFVDLDLGMQARLSPLERYYISEAVNVVRYLKETFCENPEPEDEVVVSAECQAGYDRAASCMSIQTVGVITRPFLPVTEVDSFCSHFFEIETCVESSLSVCTAAERTTSISRYLESLRLKTYTACLDRYRAPASCTPRVAESCLLSLTAYMENGNISAAHQCGALSATLKCVTNHTFECGDADMKKINVVLSQVAAKFRDACPALVKPLLCSAPSGDTCMLTTAAISSCVATINGATLDPSSLYEIEMSMALEETLECLRGLTVACTDAELTPALTALDAALGSGVSLPRGTSFTIDDLRPSCPLTLPKCAVMSAMTCLESRLSVFTGSNILDVARASASCIWANINGCNSIQQSVFKVTVTQIFTTKLTLTVRNPSPFSVLISSLSQAISTAFMQPKYGLWDICFAATKVSEEFERVFIAAGEGNMFERALLQRGHDVLERFTSYACNDIDLVGEVVTISDTEPDTCQKASIVRYFNYYLVQSFFSGFMTTSDTLSLCQATSFMSQSSTKAAIETCSAGFQKQINFAYKHLLVASTYGVCQSAKVCYIEGASQCVSELGLAVSEYGISKSQQDVCATLRRTDKCVEMNTYRCIDVLTTSFRTRYVRERSVAMQICGGLDDETFIPRCRVDRVKYQDNCNPMKAFECISRFIDNVVMMPTLSRGRQCVEYTSARQCLQKTAMGCIAQGDQKSYDYYVDRLNSFFGDSTCDMSDYEEDCEDGCQLQEAEECVSTLRMKIMENKEMRGMDICVGITEARACLTTRTWKCSSALRTRLSGKLEVILRTANLQDNDCVNVYGCMADLEGLAASIFNFNSDDIDDIPKIRRPIEARNPDLSMDSLCVLADEAWECIEYGFNLLPAKKGKIIKMAMANVYRVIKHRCSNTVRQSCYVCDGAESNDECNEEMETCGDHYQACENIVRRGSDRVLRYYKSCVRPSFCGLGCSGDDCTSSCCVGDLCNEAHNAKTDIESMTCRLDYALMCSINLVRSFVDYKDIQCSSSQLNLECMEKYSRDCRSDSYSSLSSTAYQVLSSISRTSCSIKVTDANCGSKAILSTYSILKGGYTTLSKKICTAVVETAESVKRIEDQRVCTLSELIPVRQSLSIIKQQTRRFCSEGDNSASCEVNVDGAMAMGNGRCSGMFLKTAICLGDVLTKFNTNGKDYCEAYRSETSCLDYLKYCDVPASIKPLVDLVTVQETSNCGAPPPAPCYNDVCDIVEARGCYADSVFVGLNAGEYCPSLREAKACVTRRTSTCFSLQEMTVVEGFNGQLKTLGMGCDIEELEVKDDIFKGLTVCLIQYTEDLEAGFLSEDDMIGGLCRAYDNSKICTSTTALPLLSESFTKAALNEFNQNLGKFLENRCGSNSEGGETKARRKRQLTTCNMAEATKCMKLYTFRYWSIASIVEGRALFCREMEGLQKCVSDNMAGCTETKKDAMNTLMPSSPHCVPLIYKEEGCDREMIERSKLAIEQLVNSAEVSNEEVCVNAYRAMKWIRKFSKTCSDFDDIQQIHRQYFGGILGNSCPKLTVGLFCGKDAPVDRSCQHELAEFCLNSIDLSIEAEALPGFCSDLIANVTCARHNVDGCLASETDDVANGMALIEDDITARPCEVADSLLDYDDVCTAKPTCSIKGARKCLQDLLDETYSLDDCPLSQRKKNCMSGHIQGCNYIQIPMVQSLYGVLLPEAEGVCSSSNIFPLTVSPFAGDMLPDALSDEVNCMTQVFDELEQSLLRVTFNPQKRFCSLVYNYEQCRGDEAFGMTPLKNYLNDHCSSILTCSPSQDICKDGTCIGQKQLCDETSQCADGSDETDCDVEESDACSQRKAAFCLMNQIGSTFMIPYLSLSDKQDMCNQRESVRTCVTARTAACSDRVKDFFKGMLEASETQLNDQKTCEEPKMCIVEQASQCVDDLAVVVAKLDLAEDKTVMCNQYLKTKKCVTEFSATCAEQKLSTVQANFDEVEALIDDKCDDVEEPPKPKVLCPDIPEEDRKCEVFNAMTCTLASYESIFVYNPANSWENSKSCRALQSTIRCVASNISGCDPEDTQDVTTRLDLFRERMKERCPFVEPSLCGKPGPCPVDEAHCVSDFKAQLASPTGRGVCKIIEEAQDCISINTINCSPQSWALADFNLQKAIGEMKIKVRCDDVNIDDCMLTFQRQAEEILITGVSEESKVCDNIAETFTCLTDRISTAQIADEFQPILQNLIDKVKPEMENVCGETADPCSDDQSIHNILAIGTYLATTAAFDKQEFCSNVGLMLSKVDSTKLSACDSSSLTGLKSDLEDSFTSLCQTTVTCQQLKTDAEACINSISATSTCKEFYDAQFCVGTSIGQCADNRDDLMTAYYGKESSFPAACTRFPILAYSLSPDSVIYMTEGGPSVDLIIINEEPSLLATAAAEIKIRVVLDATESTVPICSDGREISQLVTDKCSMVFTSDGETQSDFTFTAVADNRIDGYQTVTGTLVVESYSTSGSKDLIGSKTLPSSYNFVIQDRDVKKAISSSINDPHIQTFDSRKFNYMGTGVFLMYESLGEFKIQVQLEFQACGEGGSCNSGVFIGIDNDVIVFDRSDETQRLAPFVPELKIQGEFTKAVEILKSADSKLFQINVATGLIIKVGNSDGLPNVWILASANDRENTRGLCGLFDGDRYNDLMMPNGTKYETRDEDMTYNSLTPNRYTQTWRVAVEDQLHDGLQETVADTTFLQTCNDCTESTGPQCNAFAATEMCDLTRDGSKDITKELVTMALQENGGKRRKKRQAVNPDVERPQPGWPTASGWTEVNATEFCTNQVEDPQLTKLCEQAALMVNETFESDQHIVDCIADIRLTDGTSFILPTLNDLKLKCVDQISKDPNFIKDPELKKLIDEILNLYCTPSDCNGHGRCIKGNCRCDPGYLGSDCAINKQYLQPPVITGLRNNGLCQFSDTQNCTEIYVQGGNFVESEFLTCHMEFVEIDSTGYRQIGGRKFLVAAEMMSSEMVTCKVNTEVMKKTAVLVTVSNDGNKHPAHHVFIAYDPTCHDCSPTSRRCYGPITGCDIEGRCYPDGAAAANDSCLECQPDNNQHLWTQKSGLKCMLTEYSGQSGSDLKMLIALPAACAVILFAMLAVIIALVRKRRSRRNRKNQGLEHYPSMYQNPAYEAHDDNRHQTMTATDMEPQNSFRGRHIFPRANTRGHDAARDSQY